MSSHILPSDINSNLHQVLMRAENIHFNKLINNGRDAIALNQNMFLGSTFGLIGTLATMVYAPAIAVTVAPVAGPLFIAGIFGAGILGQYNKYQARKEMDNVVKEFCKIEGIDYNSTLTDSTTTGYKSHFLNKVVTSAHITPTATTNVVEAQKEVKQQVQQIVETKATESLQESLNTVKENVYTNKNSLIKPSHLNKTVSEALRDIKNNNRKFLMDRHGGGNLPATDVISFGATTVFMFGSLAGIVAAPAVMAPLMPAIAVVGMAGLVGSLVLGQYHKFKEKSEMKQFVTEFCEKSGVDPERYVNSFNDPLYRSKLLDQVITETHITPSMKADEVKSTIDNASQKASLNILENIKSSLPSFDITSRIKNSASAFMKGYQAAKEEMEQKNSPKSPKM